MAPRVILGTRGTDVGMWVSAPGKSALSATFEDLLIDTTRINTQPIFKGQVVNPTINYNSTLSTPIVYTYPVVCDPPLYTNCYQIAQFAAPGVATYTMDVLTHNLGYIPLCHISIGSPNAGDTYPQVYLTTSKLYLRYDESKNGETGWNGYYWQTRVDDNRPASINFAFTMNYTIFRQRAV